MSNNGKLISIDPKFKSIQVAQFGKWIRVFIDGQTIDVSLTFEKKAPATL